MKTNQHTAAAAAAPSTLLATPPKGNLRTTLQAVAAVLARIDRDSRQQREPANYRRAHWGALRISRAADCTAVVYDAGAPDDGPPDLYAAAVEHVDVHRLHIVAIYVAGQRLELSETL